MPDCHSKRGRRVSEKAGEPCVLLNEGITSVAGRQRQENKPEKSWIRCLTPTQRQQRAEALIRLQSSKRSGGPLLSLYGVHFRGKYLTGGLQRNEVCRRQTGQRVVGVGEAHMLFFIHCRLAAANLTSSLREDMSVRTYTILTFLYCAGAQIPDFLSPIMLVVWFRDALMVAFHHTKANQEGERTVGVRHLYDNRWMLEIYARSQRWKFTRPLMVESCFWVPTTLRALAGKACRNPRNDRILVQRSQTKVVVPAGFGKMRR